MPPTISVDERWPRLITGMVVAVFLLELFSGQIIDLADGWSDALTLTAQAAP